MVSGSKKGELTMILYNSEFTFEKKTREVQSLKMSFKGGAGSDLRKFHSGLAAIILES